MFADVSESMASGPGCGPEQAAPSSSVAAPRVGASSPPEGRPYTALRSGAAFQEVYRRGARRSVDGIVVIRMPGRPGPPQLGVVASRQVGNAVRRNRAKRRLRAAAAQVPLERDTAYVLIASTEVCDVPFPRLIGWLQDALRADEEDT